MPGTATSFTINDADGAYEYRVSSPGRGNGYVYAGAEVDEVEDRGTVLLVIDQSHLNNDRNDDATELGQEIERFTVDLAGDGWQVRQAQVERYDIPREAPPATDAASIDAFFGGYRDAVASTKSVIQNVYDEPGTDLRAIILIGHVPVPYSGD